ncbi:hypothetical protein VP1G_01773 [Cytospora mali]|uniref:Uncharacterized protein n=1 Tax=Cytospora mali TaxID=578113 RepID=A0A194URU4_CYTMA|nr:hypothetical protein VP1G_01773 [Valsa mali var. pyri (nom. inval.)]
MDKSISSILEEVLDEFEREHGVRIAPEQLSQATLRYLNGLRGDELRTAILNIMSELWRVQMLGNRNDAITTAWLDSRINRLLQSQGQGSHVPDAPFSLVGNQTDAVASNGPQTFQGFGSAVVDAATHFSGRRPKPPQIFQEPIDGVATAVASKVAQASQGGSSGAVGVATMPDGRRPKPPQIAQEMVDSIVTDIEKHNRRARKKGESDRAKLRSQIREKYITPYLPSGADRSTKIPCEVCKEIFSNGSMVDHIIRKHPTVSEVPRINRPLYPCDVEGCDALKENHLPIVLADHKSAKHGIDAPKKEYTTQAKYLSRKSASVLRHHNIEDGYDLNDLKKGVRRVEKKLAKIIPQYKSRHGLDLATTYPTDENALRLGKKSLVQNLINLRTDGLKKGKLLCQPEKEGEWKEVLSDLQKALRRVQNGQALVTTGAAIPQETVRMAPSSENQQQELWFLKSTFPVFFPSHPALTIPNHEFDAFLREDVKKQKVATESSAATQAVEDNAVVDTDTSTTGDEREDLARMTADWDDVSMAHTTDVIAEDSLAGSAQGKNSENDHPLMKGLMSHQDAPKVGQIGDMENKMRTENGDIAHRSTGEALVDLFTDLEDVISGPRLLELLNEAWREDPESTLKIIFNARSIHLGKASRQTFYRCAGWLAKYHPLTLVANLSWLSRPEDMDDNDPARFDAKWGVSHGYWKDLLNLLALHVNGKLDVLANPRDILNIEQEKNKKIKWPKNQEVAKAIRHEKRDARHEAAVKALKEDSVYRALHLAVARLFAGQLKTDLALLRSDNQSAKRKVSLCAKWAPSSTHFHDKHTFIVSSIAEIMYLLSTFKGFSNYDGRNDDESNDAKREFYLRHARESYRKDVAALRKHLECVERDITTNSFENIKYDRIPSLAMNNYAPLFAKKDTDRFEKYIDNVVSGKARISGATVLPSTLIKVAREMSSISIGSMSEKRKKGTKDLIDMKIAQITAKTIDGQWKTLVQRIKDSGTLENCIAVADVSGSMGGPLFPDGTCPMDSSIGLSLLIAEVAKPPFGGAFITFSEDPSVQKIDLSKGLVDKYNELEQADWDMTTNFVAVFEKLILPMAIENQLKQEDMVKRVFVFSDMQFDEAETDSSDGDASDPDLPEDTAADALWSTSHERIAKKFQEAGYEMPELVFWNLAGGRAGYVDEPSDGDPVAPKPVTAANEGTALVSGYSQGMLKVFLENGSFEDENAEEEIVEEIGDDDEVVVEKRKKQKLDPLAVVKRAIGHPAYRMLQVVD